jgi:hypothetical protein
MTGAFIPRFALDQSIRPDFDHIMVEFDGPANLLLAWFSSMVGL